MAMTSANRRCDVLSDSHLASFLYSHFGIEVHHNKMTKRVCIIGAGISGLTSARYLKEAGINFTVLEATRYVGGTWRLDPHIGTDENGLPLFTSMYENLRTNLPKQTMVLRGFPQPETWPSFPTGNDYYNYVQDYAKHFDLLRDIKFLYIVTLLSRDNNKWKVKYKHVLTKEEFEEDFDYVIVCNGHNSKPTMPNFAGEKLFQGRIIHSHDYRKPDPYKDRRVLIVGSGPSGLDIGHNVAEVSKYVVHSHHDVRFKNYTSNYIMKPDLKEFNETGAIFVDDSFEEVDDVIYCTGYESSHYPFMDESCGLTLEPQFVYPLYQNLVNIREPTMIIIAQVLSACIVLAIDAQAQYATALIKGDFMLPSQNDMMQEWKERMAVISAKKLRPSYMHVLGGEENEHYAKLSAESGIERVPPVMVKIRIKNEEARLENFHTYRDYDYIINDQFTYTRKVKKEMKNKKLNY